MSQYLLFILKAGNSNLHCDDAIIYQDLFGKEISTDGSFVACAELFVDLKVA
jgi:hypothetical protein